MQLEEGKIQTAPFSQGRLGGVMADVHLLAHQGHATGEERTFPCAAQREQVQANPWALLWDIQPGAVCFQG